MSQIDERKSVERLEKNENMESEIKIQMNETNRLLDKEKSEMMPESLDKLNNTPHFKNSVNFENQEILPTVSRISLNVKPSYQLDFIENRYLSVNKKIIFEDKENEPILNSQFPLKNPITNEPFNIDQQKFIQEPIVKIGLNNNITASSKAENQSLKSETQLFKPNPENNLTTYNIELFHNSNQNQINELYRKRYKKLFVSDNIPSNRVELVNNFKSSLEQIHTLYLSKNKKKFHKDKNKSLPQEITKQRYLDKSRICKEYKIAAIRKFKQDKKKSPRLDLIRDEKPNKLEKISNQYKDKVMKKFKLDRSCEKLKNNNTIMNMPTPNKVQNVKLQYEKGVKISPLKLKLSEFKWENDKEGKYYSYNPSKCLFPNSKIEYSTLSFIDEQENTFILDDDSVKPNKLELISNQYKQEVMKKFKLDHSSARVENNNALMNMPTPNKIQNINFQYEKGVKISPLKWENDKGDKYYSYKPSKCLFPNSKIKYSTLPFIDDQENSKNLKSTFILDDDSVKNLSDEKIHDSEKVKKIEIKKISTDKRYYKYELVCLIMLLISFIFMFYKY